MDRPAVLNLPFFADLRSIGVEPPWRRSPAEVFVAAGRARIRRNAAAGLAAVLTAAAVGWVAVAGAGSFGPGDGYVLVPAAPPASPTTATTAEPRSTKPTAPIEGPTEPVSGIGVRLAELLPDGVTISHYMGGGTDATSGGESADMYVDDGDGSMWLAVQTQPDFGADLERLFSCRDDLPECEASKLPCGGWMKAVGPADLLKVSVLQPDGTRVIFELQAIEGTARSVSTPVLTRAQLITIAQDPDLLG